MNKKPSRRRKLVCSKGPQCKAKTDKGEGAAFSTHSSIRKVCHACAPKCTEQHLFGNHPTAVAHRKKLEQAAKEAEKIAPSA